MRLILCADLHLDSKLQTWLPEGRAKERRNELLMNFPRLCEYAVNANVDGILIAGDLFDRSTVSKLAENAVLSAITETHEITFYYVPGNHDEKCFLTRLEQCPGNLVLFNDRLNTITINGKGNVTLTSVKLTEQNHRTFHEDLILDRNRFNIVMLHGMEGVNRPAFEDNLDFSLLKNRYVDLLALGHIHAPSLVPLDQRGTVIYPGCLEGRGFDECGEHGFYIADIDEDTMTSVYSFVPFAKRRFIMREVDCTGVRSTGEIAEKIEEAIEDSEFKGTDYLKLRLVGKADALCEKDAGYLSKLFEGRAEAVRINDETGYMVDYDDFANDPTLKGEFVRIVRNSTLSEEDKAMVIRMGINALMGEQPD